MQRDRLQLEVHDLEVPVLTGIYSEETHLPQPLRISLTVDLDCPDRFTPDSPLGDSKNYLDLKRAATDLPEGRHFILIEGVADRSEEHTSELQSLLRISYAVFCLKK